MTRSTGSASAPIITDHPFQVCGAGSKTTDTACYVVRELGGRRDLCHAGSRVAEACQQPREEHAS